MKYIYLFLIGVIFLSCGKEDALKNEINFSNIYAITDDPNDPVQHERYRIYDEFGVSVYFNDTVNQEFVKTDVYGNPVYRYELIDPTWLFYKPESGTGNTSVEYRFVYAEGEEKQLKILMGIRRLLENVSEALYPTMVMSADSIYKINSLGEIEEKETSFETNFRVMLWCRVDEMVDDGSLDDAISSIEKSLVLDKVENFTSKVDEFGTISEAVNYGKDLFVYPTSDPWFGYSGYYLFYGRPSSMDEDYLDDLQARWPAWAEFAPTQEHVDESRSVFASIVGPYGFVGTSNVLTVSPNSVTIDLNQYVELMLRFSPEEFQKYFGGYSLVMKKYNILYDVIVNEMGVEL